MPNLPASEFTQPPHQQADQANASDHDNHNNDQASVGGEGAPARRVAADGPPQQPRDGGFDSGRGESSDGDSPQSPRLRAALGSAVKNSPASDPSAGLLPSSDGDAKSDADRSADPSAPYTRSPRKGGHSRHKNTASAPEKWSGSGGKGKPSSLPHSVVTQAEIYPEASLSEPPAASAERTSSTVACWEADGSGTVSADCPPARLETVDERSAVKGDQAGAEKVDRTKPGGKGEAGEGDVEVHARGSVVSSSDVSIHSTGGGAICDKGRKLTLEGRDVDSLTPVTEV